MLSFQFQIHGNQPIWRPCRRSIWYHCLVVGVLPIFSRWKDTRGDQYDNWGTCTYYFETEDDGFPVRHIEVYENGNVLRYSEQNLEDEFGTLANNKLYLKYEY